MSTWLTVPTALDRPSLWPLLEACGVAPEQIVVVVTTDQDDDRLSNYRVIWDTGPPNIQRWWNRGIDLAEDNGADVCIVVNDDVVAYEPLTRLAEVMAKTEATITQPDIVGMCGWCYALNLRDSVRPDESYQWWYGDNDMWHRALEASGVTAVPLLVQHLPRDYSALTDWQARLVEEDQKLFLSRHSMSSMRAR